MIGQTDKIRSEKQKEKRVERRKQKKLHTSVGHQVYQHMYNGGIRRTREKGAKRGLRKGPKHHKVDGKHNLYFQEAQVK